MKGFHPEHNPIFYAMIMKII